MAKGNRATAIIFEHNRAVEANSDVYYTRRTYWQYVWPPLPFLYRDLKCSKSIKGFYKEPIITLKGKLKRNNDLV